MNANELADWLENVYEEVFPNQQDIVDMLRQQQEKLNKYELRNEEQRNRITHLETKEQLTEEEIWEVIDNCFGVHAFNLDYQITLDEAREDAFELVKAALRKAQKK